MSVEAMKQWLEALEDMHIVELAREDLQNWNKVVKSLRQAIAEEEKQKQDEPVDMYYKDLNCPHCGGSGLLYDVAITEAEKLKNFQQFTSKMNCSNNFKQDEPVAYRYKMGVGDDYWVWNYCAYPDNKDDPRCEPLYTRPQQRTWVGLTFEEIGDEYVRFEVTKGGFNRFEYAVQAIEAKLKEKNNGSPK